MSSQSRSLTGIHNKRDARLSEDTCLHAFGHGGVLCPLYLLFPPLSFPEQAPEDMPPLEGEEDDASRMEEVD